MNKTKTYRQGLVAMIPTYMKMKGDGTRVLTEDKGEHYEIRSIKRLLNYLAKQQLLDLKACKEYYGEKLGCKNLLPIPLNKNTILIPVKTRSAISKHDGVFSYINLNYIEEIVDDNKNGVIILKDGREIITKQRVDTIKKRITYGKLIREMINMDYPERVIEKDLFEDYNAPVTKGDFIALRNEIIYIKQKLNT